MIAPTWEVNPETVLSAIDLMRRSDESNAPVGRRSASVAERDRLIGEVRAKLAGNEEARATFEAGLQSAQVFLSGRPGALGRDASTKFQSLPNRILIFPIMLNQFFADM